MKSLKNLTCIALLLTSTALAEEKVDRSQRTNPYANTPSYAQGGNTSRYDTSNGWSRGGSNYWSWGYRGSDIPTTGYTPPVAAKNKNSYHENKCGSGAPIIVAKPNIHQEHHLNTEHVNNKPNCGSGTVFDGHGCKIVDSRLKKPDGDGYINPCKNGAWFSNGRCVR